MASVVTRRRGQRPHLTAAERAFAARAVAREIGAQLELNAWEHRTPNERRAIHELVDALNSRARRLQRKSV